MRSYILTSALFLYVAAIVTAQYPLSLTNNQGCGALHSNADCTQCIRKCSKSIAICAINCVWRPSACKGCIERYSPWPGCVSCIHQCFHWGRPNAMVCVDCNDATLQSNMCLGSRGELGFCVATGDGLLIDNGGSGCGGRTPDCDVASGTISQCPASFFNGINAASPASSQSPAESRSPHAPPGDSIPAVGLGSISTSRRKRVVQPEGAGA